MIITIDGAAGTGKSLAAVNLASALKFQILNTGNMYRAAALALTDAGIDIHADPRDVPAIQTVLGSLRFELQGDELLLNGQQLNARIVSPQTSTAASLVSKFPEVRQRLKAEQRRLAEGRNIVCEGRDQGTSVFPDAPVKFFLITDLEVRARRRQEQLLRQGHSVELDAVRQQIVLRDAGDMNRPIDPLRAAPDSVTIDTTNLTPEAVLQQMLAVVNQCRSRA